MPRNRQMADNERMAKLVELRNGRTPHAAAVSAATVFLVAGGAWVGWQLAQEDAPTLLRSESETWLTLLAAGTVIVTVVGAVFWRGRNVRLGLVTGLALAILAVLSGLVVDIITSIS